MPKVGQFSMPVHNKQSCEAKISSDGSKVAFATDATNIITTDTNESCDVMIRDIQNQTTIAVSMSDDDTQGNDDSYNLDISSDGLAVAFASHANNLVSNDTNERQDIFVRDVTAAQ